MHGPADPFAEIDRVVEHHMGLGNLPGAVVLVGHQDAIVFERAYGNRSVEPEIEAMTLSTIFDLASLTKVVATAPAVMLLAQRGQLKLEDPVSKHLPAFGRAGKKKVTVGQLLVHYSGLPADLRQSRRRRISSQSVVTRIYRTRLLARPGQKFIYSDLGFVVLGKLVEKVSRQSLAQFVRENIFSPLGMTSTCFLPRAEDTLNIAPTERRREGGLLRGQVHDSLAGKLGGIAGDAGLFSTASDLARFCQMLLQRGKRNGVEVLHPETVALMTSPQSPDGKPNVRGFGWDIQSTYSSVKGSFFSARSYGHTGYTGTSLWIDPETETFLIILTNRVHPEGKGNVKELRTELANIVGRMFQPASLPAVDANATHLP
ncbi:MAG: beta-lactamase family protein [Acidobacteria bacterium]|nr:beta-lactamase family protein [Acidobacteriota bacterium]MCI0721779.1 beta-lactamase family protein [Acidobacteriota bacterium]